MLAGCRLDCRGGILPLSRIGTVQRWSAWINLRIGSDSFFGFRWSGEIHHFGRGPRQNRITARIPASVGGAGRAVGRGSDIWTQALYALGATAGRYASCLRHGFVRRGSSSVPPITVTVGVNGSSHDLVVAVALQ